MNTLPLVQSSLDQWLSMSRYAGETNTVWKSVRGPYYECKKRSPIIYTDRNGVILEQWCHDLDWEDYHHEDSEDTICCRCKEQLQKAENTGSFWLPMRACLKANLSYRVYKYGEDDDKITPVWSADGKFCDLTVLSQ